MGLELSRPLEIGVVIMAVLVIVQTLFTSILLTSSLRRLGSLCQELTRTSRRLQTAVRLAHDQLENLIPILTTVSGWVNEASEQSGAVRDSAREIEEKATRGLDAARERVHAVASQMDRAVNRISTDTYRIHRSIIAPAHHISALIQAGRSIVEEWFGQDRRPADVYTKDEDIFI